MSSIPQLATKPKIIAIAGPVSVEKVPNFDPPNRSYGGLVVYVLLGPTGSGKSTFIESVAPNTSLCLSSNKLEGFTQSLTIYRMVNAQCTDTMGQHPIYLVDVPGFADSKISSLSIVSMLRKMIQKDDHLANFFILFFIPIHNPRLSGSQRRVLRTFESLTGPGSAGRITIVSTMWDLIWSESASIRAESNFTQLRDEIWKAYIDRGSKIVKFHNTQESALTILDDALEHEIADAYPLQNSVSQPLRQTPFASDIYDDLQTRIQDLQLKQTNIQSELQEATERSDGPLKAALIPQLEEVQMLLAKFKQELHDFESGVDILPTPVLNPSTKKGLLTKAMDSVKHLEKKLHRSRDR
ncbi:hypothetical protein BJ165DRAFT_301688 [Panaeolus papilionaceus]|nr:hypothetical protein BJ165DRAFT_301688 [Panaeolus papilionaceus]